MINFSPSPNTKTSPVAAVRQEYTRQLQTAGEHLEATLRILQQHGQGSLLAPLTRTLDEILESTFRALDADTLARAAEAVKLTSQILDQFDAALTHLPLDASTRELLTHSTDQVRESVDGAARSVEAALPQRTLADNDREMTQAHAGPASAPKTQGGARPYRSRATGDDARASRSRRSLGHENTSGEGFGF